MPRFCSHPSGAEGSLAIPHACPCVFASAWPTDSLMGSWCVYIFKHPIPRHLLDLFPPRQSQLPEKMGLQGTHQSKSQLPRDILRTSNSTSRFEEPKGSCSHQSLLLPGGVQTGRGAGTYPTTLQLDSNDSICPRSSFPGTGTRTAPF